MGLPPATNARARASVPVGLLSVLAVPAGVVLSWYSVTVTLIDSLGSAGVAFLLGAYAVVLARRGHETIERTLGRSGGERAARTGRVLGTIGLCVALTTGLAAGFYGLLVLFAR